MLWHAYGGFRVEVLVHATSSAFAARVGVSASGVQGLYGPNSVTSQGDRRRVCCLADESD